MPPAAVVNTISHYTGAAGLLASLPAIATGVMELCVRDHGGWVEVQLRADLASLPTLPPSTLSYGMWTGQTKQKGDVKTTVSDAVEKKDVAGGSPFLTLSRSRPVRKGCALTLHNGRARRREAQDDAHARDTQRHCARHRGLQLVRSLCPIIAFS